MARDEGQMKRSFIETATWQTLLGPFFEKVSFEPLLCFESLV